jgi:hypothetical protein
MDEEKYGGYSGEMAADEPEEALIVDEKQLEQDWNGEESPEDAAWEDKTGSVPADEGEDGVPGAEERYKLKYLGQELDVSREELITLAQKGKDYDRIRDRADMLMDTIRKMGVEAAGADSGGAERFPEDPEDEGSGEATGYVLRREYDISEFCEEYRDVDPREIPQEVWANVSAGMSLLNAYQGYENRRLKAEIAAERKQSENRARTTGSRQSAGSIASRGDIEDDWYRND